ncbi:hypothetical protein [Streptomyces sp. I05A-00742]|uniref:hypothetical protein n=1 Tax=Streptomyces sp. I05A-00742 TaxID=2732853 RepID=UPI00148889DE|nr:hypothetical protein [Streptomyces sp. I05A-00742]
MTEEDAVAAVGDGTPGPDAEAVPDAAGTEPAGPRPLGVDRTPTGNAGVDAHLARLEDADHLAADGHLEVYEDVHQGLRTALAALDERAGPPQGPTRPYDNRS